MRVAEAIELVVVLDAGEAFVVGHEVLVDEDIVRALERRRQNQASGAGVEAGLDGLRGKLAGGGVGERFEIGLGCEWNRRGGDRVAGFERSGGGQVGALGAEAVDAVRGRRADDGCGRLEAGLDGAGVGSPVHCVRAWASTPASMRAASSAERSADCRAAAERRSCAGVSRRAGAGGWMEWWWMRSMVGGSGASSTAGWRR